MELGTQCNLSKLHRPSRVGEDFARVEESGLYFGETLRRIGGKCIDNDKSMSVLAHFIKIYKVLKTKHCVHASVAFRSIGTDTRRRLGRACSQFNHFELQSGATFHNRYSSNAFVANPSPARIEEAVNL